MSVDNEIFKQLVELIKEENNKQTDIIRQTLKAEITDLKQEIYDLKVNDKQTQDRIATLEETNKILKERNDYLERKLKKNNIIIFGLKTKTRNVTEEVISTLNQLLQINLNTNQVNNIYEVGKKEINKPIVVEFISYITKLEVLKNCKKLKGTEINISEDLPKKDRELRKRLLKHQKEAREKKLYAFIRGNKLFINDEAYTIEDLEKEEISKQNTPPEKKKSASAPATPSNFGNTDDDTLDTNEENEDEYELGKTRDVKKIKSVKSIPHRRRQPTRRKVEEQSTSDSSKNQKVQKSNVN